jgi:Alpha/beta hydrolase of unknown function (DUF900)
MKVINRANSLWVIAGCALLCTLASNLNAQDTNVDWGTASDDQVILQAIEQTTPTPSNEIPAFANFYSAQHSPISAQPWPPLPGNVEQFNGWDLGSNIWVLDDLNFSYDLASSTQSGHSMMAMDDSGLNPPGDDGTNTIFPPDSPVEFDYGTNLWIAQETISGGNFTGIISNTIADVPYQLLLATNLASPQWVDGNIFVGSETTNWTPWSVPWSPTNNLFVNVLSLQESSGAGIPDWWLLKYYGQDTNVNIEALAPANDGWTIYQQYALGDSPYTWATPPPPIGLAVVYNPNTGNAAVSWAASPLATGYTVQRNNGLEENGTSESFTFSAGTTNFVDNSIPSQSVRDLAENGPQRLVYYSIQAQYSGSQNSEWSPAVWLQSWQEEMSASIVQGSEGDTYLAVNDLPPNTVALKLSAVQVSVSPSEQGSYYTNFDLAVTNSVNGLYAMDDYQVPIEADGHDDWYVQAVNANGSLGAAVPLDGYVPPPVGGTTNNWATPPFYDGRAQLKQNLIFLLRDPGIQPFSYDIQGQSGDPEGNLTQEPAGYAAAGYYDTLPSWNGYTMSTGGNGLDVYRPFFENYIFANFQFSPNDMYENGVSFYATNRLTPYASLDGLGYLLLTNTPPSLFQQPTTASQTIPAQLNDTQPLYSYPFDLVHNETNDDGFIVTTTTYNGSRIGDFTMQNPALNYFGIPIQSADAYFVDQDLNFQNESVSPGNSFLSYGAYVFPDTAQPQLQTVEYDFWNADSDTLPGNGGFSPTTPVQHFQITSAGGILNVAGYAKMAVQNGYPGVYGYLGQYFDQAYQIDTNGTVTTNSAGVLSPYGQFFDTQPGPVALVTQTDLDTGERGTDTVYALKLQLDVNHDGTMDLSSTGPDNTSEMEPYTFWCNNNFDRWKTDTDAKYGGQVIAKPLGVYYTEFEQDDQEDGASGYYPYPSTPDCNYLNASGNRQIPCTRDLEDFARLWICGVTSNLLASLPAGASATLSINSLPDSDEFLNPTNVPPFNNPGAPTIDLFVAADPDGGIGYQTNELTASNQIDLAQSPYIGRLGPGDSIQLNSLLNQVPFTHFIWCGVSNGIGQLTLTISNGTNILGQTSAYIQIEDIKQLYERWTVGNNYNALPTNVPSLTSEGLPAGVTAFQYPWPQQATPYFLFVHGYNMDDLNKDFFAQTAYKRLYWQGYQGRFGAFQWPTTVANITGPHFDQSEYESWNSGAGLLNLLVALNSEYSGQVYVMAHSHGNVATGEALRQATEQGLGQIVNTYVAAQAAVDSHTYDPTTPERSYAFNTPDCYGQYYIYGATNYFNGVTAAGTFVNFYNTNDWTMAPNVWQADENEKPDSGYGYDVYSDGEFSESEEGIYTDIYFPQDTYTIFAHCDQGHAYSVGAQPNVGGQFLTGTNYNQVNLPSVWPPDPANNDYRDHLWHSAEFRSDYPQRYLFWDEALFQMGLKTHL